MKTNESTKMRVSLGVACLLALVVFFAGCSDGLFFHAEYNSYAQACDVNRTFEWYQTQMNTGPASGNNCGPTCVSMAVKFCQDRTMKVEDVRNLNYKNGGWWCMADVKNALNYFHTGYRTLPLVCKEQLFSSLSKGHILIICLNMSLLTRENNNSESRYNRFYDCVTGHFIIIKGYAADKQWFVTYDPNNFRNDFYPDRTPKGKTGCIVLRKS